MGNKKLLNEEDYQRRKKKIIGIAIIVLILGILIGGSLIVTGIIKSNGVKSNDIQNTRDEGDIQAEIDDLDSKISVKEYECNSLDMNSSTWFADKTQCQSEVSSLQSKLGELKTELWKIQSGYNDTKTSISTSKYIPFYIFGAFIIIASSMIAFSIYMFAKRREVLAFTTQQVMPVAQEGIDKMAPTVGNAFGTIAKGIKEGLKDDESDK